MPTFIDPANGAGEAQQALRGLSHASRAIEHPSEIYSVLGSLSAAAASLGQSLHQLGEFHDRPGGTTSAGRAAAFQVSWELHRAAVIMRLVSEAINHSHEIESTISYARRELPRRPKPPRSITSPGLSL